MSGRQVLVSDFINNRVRPELRDAFLREFFYWEGHERVNMVWYDEDVLYELLAQARERKELNND